jgi:DNA-directed RNA polymerase specialized sigma24 family protein
MTLDDAQTVAILKHAHVPPDQWGEAWIVLRYCLRRFDPARGELSHLFARAWQRRRISIARREARAFLITPQNGAGGLDPLTLVPAPTPAPDRAEEAAAVLRRLRPQDADFAREMARGTYDQTARRLGLPIGTVKSKIHHLRDRMRRDAA